MNKIKWIMYKVFGYRFYDRKKNSISKDIFLAHAGCLSYDNYIHIGPFCRIFGNGRVKIEKNTILGPNVSFFTNGHNYRSDMIPYNSQYDIVSTIVVGENVWIGGNVTILAGLTVGEGAVIGGGSVVTKNVDPFTIVVGNPARVMNMRNIIQWY